MRCENDCSVKRTMLVRIIDSLCAVMLVGITIWVACRYGALPDRIPIHYGADGVIDGYGGKSMIWILVAISWVLIGVISVIEQFPRFWNVPVKVTSDNKCRLLTLTWHLISTTKLVVMGIFVYLILMAMQGGNLPIFFVPAILILLTANSLYWVIRIFLNR